MADINDITEDYDHVFIQTVLVNHMRIGLACCPYEVIRVRTNSGIYPVTIIYDTGAQITLCNFKTGPLVIDTKLADKKVTISTVNSAQAKLRKIYTLTLGDDIQVDAILIPNLHLQLQSTRIPEEWEHLDEEFADQDTFNVGAQILVGADRATLFPDWMKNPDGTMMQSRTC